MAVSDQAVVTGQQLDQLCINTIRTLSMDAVQKANSGHPGTPMALAPVAYCLWQQFLRYDPANPLWPNRDRFVLSNGHASMLLYSMLHLAGVREVNAQGEILSTPAVSLEDIKNFRQLGSKTPGHPEYGLTTGVETTTGPLGQGVANSVGMAIAERWLAGHFNRPGFELFGYNIWAFCGDGDMMEGISGEAASVAGHLRLSNLCWIYDNNQITIEGKTDLAFNEDVARPFQSLWLGCYARPRCERPGCASECLPSRAQRHRPSEIYHRRQPHRLRRAAPAGHQRGARRAARRRRNQADKAILWLAGGCEVSCSRRRTRKFSRCHWQARRASEQANGIRCLRNTALSFPSWPTSSTACSGVNCPTDGTRISQLFPPTQGTRDSRFLGQSSNAIAKNHPWLMGGAADLYPSTKTRLTFDGAGDFEPGNYNGRNFTSEFANMPWVRLSMECQSRSFAFSARHSLFSPIT